MDLQCLQRQGISGFSRTRVNTLLALVDGRGHVVVPMAGLEISSSSLVFTSKCCLRASEKFELLA